MTDPLNPPPAAADEPSNPSRRRLVGAAAAAGLASQLPAMASAAPQKIALRFRA